MSLPVGWGERKNQMSEKDIQLGGDAATKFAQPNAYSNAESPIYQTSEQVRAYYYQKQQDKQQLSLPVGWEGREKLRQFEQEHYSVNENSGKTKLNDTVNTTIDPQPSDFAPESALLQLAIHSLNTLSETLEHSSTKLSMEEQRAFAEAVQRVMKCMQ